MKKIFVLFLVFVCATANAQVFRRTGPDGQVYFSDQPGQDAEPVDVRPAQTFSLPPVPEQTGSAEQQGDEAAGQAADVPAAYSVFTIISPVSEQAVRANDGNVTVHLLLQPGLMPGHTIALKIDGEDGKNSSTGDGMRIELGNLSRGLHTIQATVVDAEGHELIQTASVSFNVLRVAQGNR